MTISLLFYLNYCCTRVNVCTMLTKRPASHEHKSRWKIPEVSTRSSTLFLRILFLVLMNVDFLSCANSHEGDEWGTFFICFKILKRSSFLNLFFPRYFYAKLSSLDLIFFYKITYEKKIILLKTLKFHLFFII